MNPQLNARQWDQCHDLASALLRGGPAPSAEQLAAAESPLRQYADSCSVLCLRQGSANWFLLGGAALSLILRIQKDWRELRGTAAALRFALDEIGANRSEILDQAADLDEPVRRLLASNLPREQFGLTIRLTPQGLDIETPAGERLGGAIPTDSLFGP